MVEDRTTRFLTQWIPIAVVGNLSVAMAAFKFGWPDVPIYVLIGLTLAATITGAVFYLGSVRGVRSIEAAGFARKRDFFLAYMFGHGSRVAVVVLSFASIGVTFITGSENASGWLAFSTFLLVGLYRAVTTNYPADVR